MGKFFLKKLKKKKENSISFYISIARCIYIKKEYKI